MRPGRELDCEIAKEIFDRKVFVRKGILHEVTTEGDRPLRRYSKEMSAAWEVTAKIRMSLLPVGPDQWFALAGPESGWETPADFVKYLQAGTFVTAGAAVAETAPLAICLCALRTAVARKNPPQPQATQ
jgi:hypothetical protein